MILLLNSTSTAKFFIVASVLLLVMAKTNPQQVSLNLTLYYETLCPDSVQFIKTQLFPVWTLLGGYGNPYLNIKYVPYGHATTQFQRGVYHFQCQHGQDECDGNIMHSCALKVLPAEFHGTFIDCSMSYFYPPLAGETCSQKLNLNYTEIEECTNSAEGQKLLASYGNKTQELSPRLNYVPWITFNGNYSSTDLKQSEINLLRVVCNKLSNATDTLPSACL